MVSRPPVSGIKILPPISIHSYERYLPTAFDESMSILQKINKVINHLNDIGDITASLTLQWNDLIKWIVGNGLTDIVSAEIDKRIADGTFDELIYRIVGDLTLLQTIDKSDMVNAINEVHAIALLNDLEIGDITTLKTDDKSNLVNSINELKLAVDINLQGPISIGESTGYGTISGLKVRQQQVLAMAVEIGNATDANIVHLPNGVRYTLSSIALPVTPSHSTLNRKDIVYVDGLGVISYLEGVSAVTPVVPTLPSGGVLLAEIKVDATDTTVNDVDIADKRDIKALSHLLTTNKSNLVQAINEVITSLNGVINDAIGDVANLPTSDKSNIVNAIIEIVNESATKVDLGDKNLLTTDDKSSIVNAIIEVINESATKIDLGDKLLLPTDDKSSIVNAIIEVINESAAKIDLGDKSLLPTDDKSSIVSAIIEVINESATKIDLGDKTLLPTTDKSSIVNAIIEIVASLNDVINNAVGDIANLPTADKSSVVNAIIEVVNESATKVDVGVKSTLLTTDKTSIVNAVNEVNTKLKDAMIVNVKSVGAMGGLIDDTAVIQNLINTIPDGSTIIGDGKTHIVTGLDIKRSNIKIKNLKLKLKDGDNHWKSPIRIVGTWTSPVKNIELEDLFIDGNRSGQTNIRVNAEGTIENRGGIALHGVISDVFINRCLITHTAGDGIWLTAGHIEVTGTWQAKDDTQLCINNVKVYNSIFIYNRRHGGALDSCYDVVFENCIFEHNGTTLNAGATDGDKGELYKGALYGMGFDAESMIPGANFREIRFSNCTFQHNAGIALGFMHTADDLSYEPFVQLKDIIVEKCTFSGYASGEGTHTSLSFYPMAHNKTLVRKLFNNVRVTDCTFKLGSMIMASAENVFLDNLTFYDSEIMTPTVMNFNSCNNVVIAGVALSHSRLYYDGGGTIIPPAEWSLKFNRTIYSVSGFADLTTITQPVEGDLAFNNEPEIRGVRSWIYSHGLWQINSADYELKTGSWAGGTIISKWLEYTDRTGALAGFIPVYTGD